jgi:ABC-type polysaccharide/polyol phosphate transport system ATPase subunit
MIQDHILRWRKHRETFRVEAVSDVSLTVNRGEWVGISGPNGAGKTTLLQIIAGLLPVERGTVEVYGSFSSFFGLGVGFHAEQSAEENIYMHGLLHGMPPRDIREKMENIIEFAGVASHRHLPIKCYSTGMKQRLAYSAAAHIESDSYLFDEVFAVGDTDFQSKCREHLRRLRERGTTVVLVSHNLNDLRAICDRIIIMKSGRIECEEQGAGATAPPVCLP